MVQTSPTPFEVGRTFVHRYYTLLHQAPNLLYRFYSNNSTFIHGGADRPGSIEQPAVGPDDIARRIEELNLRDCHAKIRQVDSHPTIGDGVVVQVTGELSNNGNPMRRFMQTFVLACRQPKKYYVQNDIFRYQDEVFEDGSDEDDHSSSQIYGDTDKVSNADSSVAISQQPSLVPAPSRSVVDEAQIQPQPLPPRNAVSQQQVNKIQPIQQEEVPVNDVRGTNTYNDQQEITKELQKQSKQASGEGTSYAGIAKLHSSSGQNLNINTTGSVLPPVQNTNVVRAPTAKPTNRTNTSQRDNQTNYQQSRNNTWNEHAQQESNSPRRTTSATTIPNEQQVFVGSLPSEFTRETLIECFSQYGIVIDAKIHTPTIDSKKNFGFVIFDNAEDATKVVKMEHINYNKARLNVEPKTQKSYQGNNGPQGNFRNNYQPRAGAGGNTRGSRGSFRGNFNNIRRGGMGGGQFRNNSPSYPGTDEHYKYNNNNNVNNVSSN